MAREKGRLICLHAALFRLRRGLDRVEAQRCSTTALCSTCSYAYPGGPNIATAMAVSGAAISPNWGHHTVTRRWLFLLTMFDVRLGWWICRTRAGPGWQASPLYAD